MKKSVSVNKSGKQEKKGGRRELPLRPKGMHDVLPSEWLWWNRVIGVAEKLADFYGFGRIMTPLLEHAALFTKGIGEETDIVDKEMYTLRIP